MASPSDQGDLFATESAAVVVREVVAGPLRSLRARAATPVEYLLRAGDKEMPLNALIGAQLEIDWSGRIVCIACGRDTPRSYSQGHCWTCLQTLASCDRCIVKPELCHFAAGTCREPEWGRRFCMQAHIVYLANSSGLKVGITRETNVPGRWLDQGAAQAIALLRVGTRLDAGLWEDALRAHVSDRTDWRAMLRGTPAAQDMAAAGEALLAKIDSRATNLPAAERLLDADRQSQSFEFPAPRLEGSVRAANLDKQPQVCDRLLGIKAQYLVFERQVFNVRRHAGYEVNVRAS